MEITSREIRRAACQAVRAARPAAWLVTLLYLLLTDGLNTVWDLTFGSRWQPVFTMLQQGLDPSVALPLAMKQIGPAVLFGQILLLLFTAVMGVGYQNWALKTARGEGRAQDLADGFGFAGRAILLRLLLTLYTLGWSVVFLIPAGILAGISGSRAAAAVLGAAAAAACAVYLLRYQLAPYCQLDDEKHRVLRALHASAVLMHGRTWGMVRLLLGMLGWILLPTLCFTAAQAGLLLLTGGPAALGGIVQGAPGWVDAAASVCSWLAALWATPRFAVALGTYYDRIRSAAEEPAPAPETED